MRPQVTETIHKVSQTDQIRNVQWDVSQMRYLYVQTSEQVYLYDCESLIKQTKTHNVFTGCVFVKKLLQNKGQRKVLDIKTVSNALIVYFEDSHNEILYTKDLMNAVSQGASEAFI